MFFDLITGTALVLVLVALVGAMLWLVRTRGVLPRVVGLELITGLTTALFVVLGIALGSVAYLEVALLLGLLGFVGTIAWARWAQEEES